MCPVLKIWSIFSLETTSDNTYYVALREVQSSTVDHISNTLNQSPWVTFIVRKIINIIVFLIRAPLKGARRL